VAQTVTIGEQKVCPESESLKFSTTPTPTPQVENPSDFDSSTPTPQPFFVHQRNLPYSSEEAKTVCRSCRTCAEIKPRFFKPPVQTLIKTLRPWDRLSLDFNGPVRGACPHLLVAVDEYSRFPFVSPCKNMKSSTVIACLLSLFCVFGFSSCVHNDSGSPLVRRRGLTFPLAAFLLAVPPPTTPLGTASANGSTKPFGGLFGCCHTAMVFPRIGGRRCWPKLFTPSDRSSAFLLMKCPTKDCFVFLVDP